LWILSCMYTIIVYHSIHLQAPLRVFAKDEASITRRVVLAIPGAFYAYTYQIHIHNM
jgi:hypothetical protein